MSRSLKVLLAAGAYLVIAQLIHSVGALLTMDYYMDPAYFSVWSKIMMPGEGSPPTEFFLASIGLSLIGGVIYAIAYDTLKASIPGKTILRRGLAFGLILFFVGGLPGFLSMYLLVNLPCGLTSWWIAEGFIVSLLGGTAIAAVLK